MSRLSWRFSSYVIGTTLVSSSVSIGGGAGPDLDFFVARFPAEISKYYILSDKESTRIFLVNKCVNAQLFSIFFKTNGARSVAELVLYSQKTQNVVIFYQIWRIKI